MKEIPEVQSICGCGWSGCDRAQLREDVAKVCRAYAVRVLEARAKRLRKTASEYILPGNQNHYLRPAEEIEYLADRIKAGKA